MSLLFRDIGGASPTPAGSVVCIGAFDGLHRGHQALIGRARARARELGLPLVVLSFEPLPREFFMAPEPPARLILPAAKIAGLQSLEVDVIGLLRFNPAMVAMAAEDFVRACWWRSCTPARCGSARISASATAAAAMSRCCSGWAPSSASRRTRSRWSRMPVSACRAPPCELRWRMPNSTAPHSAGPALRHPRPRRARQAARPNAGLPDREPALRRQAPADARHLRHLGAWRRRLRPMASVSSLGTRPTVNGKEPLLEAHLFDFNGDLYGKRLSVEFVAKLRDELKFDGLPALIEQMDRDSAHSARDPQPPEGRPIPFLEP
jgi:riboflavin kinase / FMN adenylyltransferase